jgi:hypothetical protein
MLIHHKEVAVAVETAEQGDSVMVEAIIEGGEPFDAARVREVVNDMRLAPEVGKELAGGDVPVAIAPGALLPAGEAVEDVAVFGIGEAVIVEGGGDEGPPGAGQSPRRERRSARERVWFRPHAGPCFPGSWQAVSYNIDTVTYFSCASKGTDVINLHDTTLRR